MLIDEYNDVKENILLNNLDLYRELSVNSHSTNDCSTNGPANSASLNNLNEKILKNNLYPIELTNYVKLYFEPLAKKFY